MLDKGISLINTSEYDSARSYFESKLDSCNTVCPDSLIAYAHIYLAKSLHLTNNYDTALIKYKEGISIFNRIDHINGIAYSQIALAEFYRVLFNWKKALEILEVVDSINTHHLLPLKTKAYFYNRFAAVYSESEIMYDSVVSFSNRVIQIARQLGDRDMEATSLNELGFIYEKFNDEIALKYYDSALNIYSEMANRRYMVGVLINLSRASFRFNHFSESVSYANKGLELCEGTTWIQAIPGFYDLQYHNYNRLNQPEKALEAYKKYHESYIEARESEWQKDLYEIEAKYDLSEKEKLLSESKHAATVAQLESEEKSRQLISSVIIAILLAMIASAIYWNFKRTNKVNIRLKSNIEQKEILMQEVHHRVKNNLTFLKSMFYLQSKASEDDDVKMILDECQSRIQSMALVHQNLYDTEDVSTVDFYSFLQELFYEIESMFDHDRGSVSIDIEVNDLKIDMKLSIFLGLILNEMITNSYKYAFTSSNHGQIKVLLEDMDEKLQLSYGDNGNGLPPDFDIQNSTGFGFKLIKILLNQINGQLSYVKNDMNTFTILIPNGK